MHENYILIFMLLCYLIPITIVCYNYDSNSAVSNIICNNNCRNKILFFMLLMGIGTLFYEIKRNDMYTLIFMLFLLFGLYGLIYINEMYVIHYVFAILVFFCIILFMLRQCYLTKCNDILLISLILELFVLIFILKNIRKNIFSAQVFYILNFAFFYLYLHYVSFIKL